jgi:chemotaxis protein methyltransferase CheR
VQCGELSGVRKSVSLTANEFNEFRRFLKDVAGIDLGDNKQYLVTTRITRLMDEYAFASVSELLSKLRLPTSKILKQQVVDAMTTNETFWFRDNHPFNNLKTAVFPELLDRNKSAPTRIWCSACSSGQEPYSISMIADEFSKENRLSRPLPIDITATDLSQTILDQARKGRYDKLAISRGMSESRLKQYFREYEDDYWEVVPDIQRRVQFRSLNLLDSFLSLGKFDIVFCRNVLIYFSAEVKEDILRRIHGVLKPGGFLFVGSSESLGRAAELFTMRNCNPGIVYIAEK